MKVSRAATTTFLSFGLAVGLASAAPHVGIADDLSYSGTPAEEATEAPEPILYDVSYVDEFCNEQLVEQIPALDATTTELKGEWYVLLDNVELNEALVVEGDAHLILTGDHTLSALGGIRVKKDSRLTLHVQAGSTANVLVRKGILRALTSEQKAEEEQMIARALEVDPEYRFVEPQILSVQPCYEVVAGDVEPSTDPEHVFDPDHDPMLVEKPVFAPKLLSRDYLVIAPHTQHHMHTQDGYLVVEDGHLTCDRCNGWFEDEEGHVVVTKPALKDSSTGIAAEAENSGTGATLMPASESGAEVITVTFDANGGSGSMDSLQVMSGESFVLPECSFEPPAGMEFSQWSLGKPGSTVSVPTSTTVRAWWKSATNKEDQPTQPQTPTDSQTTTTPTQTTSTTTNQSTQQSSSSSQDNSPKTGDSLVSSELSSAMLALGVGTLAAAHVMRKRTC